MGEGRNAIRSWSTNQKLRAVVATAHFFCRGGSPVQVKKQKRKPPDNRGTGTSGGAPKKVVHQKGHTCNKLEEKQKGPITRGFEISARQGEVWTDSKAKTQEGRKNEWGAKNQFYKNNAVEITSGGLTFSTGVPHDIKKRVKQIWEGMGGNNRTQTKQHEKGVFLGEQLGVFTG